MANARLRMARQAGKRRRTSDAQPAEELASEMLSETGALNEPEPLKNELAMSPMDDIHEAFRDQKQALETRLQELTMGKPLQKSLEPGHDVNGFRLKRTHQDFLLQEMVNGLDERLLIELLVWCTDNRGFVCLLYRSGWRRTLPRSASGASSRRACSRSRSRASTASVSRALRGSKRFVTIFLSAVMLCACW